MKANLKQQTVQGVFWSLSEKFALYGIGLITGIILARLLLPEDYGLIGMTVIFFSIADAFVNGGFGAAYIQKKEVSEIDANTVFYSNLSVSVVFYIVLWFLAPVISRFFEQEQLIILIRVMSLMIVINSFNIIQTAKLIRDINFKKKAKWNLISTGISGISGIAAAYNGLGVWSLVIQRMLSSIIVSIGLWSTSKWKPRFLFSIDSFKQLFSFGGWLLASSLFRSISNNLYRLFIGKFFPASELGYYTKAHQFQQLGSEKFSQSIQDVSFPILSKYQNDAIELKRILKKFLSFSLFFILPIMLILVVTAKPFILLLLTEKWENMVPFLQLLCFVGIFHPLEYMNRKLLMASGKSRLNFSINVIKNTLRIINVIINYRFGVVYILAGEILIGILGFIISAAHSGKSINYGVFKQLYYLKHIFIGGIIAALFSLILINEIDRLVLQLTIAGLAFLAIYIGYIAIFEKKLIRSIINLKTSIKSKSK